MQRYTNRGPVTCDEGFDPSNVKGKSVIITGGANGIGEAYVRALVKAGAYVTFGDIDEKAGKKLESELQGSAKLVKCDVVKWDDQLAMFKDALANSPSKRIDVVVANAGISSTDDVFDTDLEKEHPEEPRFKTLRINLDAALVTVKLALHYMRRQFAQDPEASKDQLLVLQDSVAGYYDIPTALQYNVSKFGMRATMRTLRWTEHNHSIRVNSICPWFVSTELLSKDTKDFLGGLGVNYATVEDAAQALLKFVSDTSINGRAFGILPRAQIKSGYADLDADDFKEGEFGKSWDDEMSRVMGRNHR